MRIEGTRKLAGETPVTHLLIAWSSGNRAALDELLPLVYQELKKLAAAYLSKERPGHTLQPTALINEAYLRMINQETPQLQNRAHFFGVAARLMRQILVDHARTRSAFRRGGRYQKISFEDAKLFSEDNPEELLALDAALKKLAQLNERQSQILEMRVFGGMSVEETAATLNISEPTVKRDTRIAQAWLRRELGI
jgi:RNA polymerase sigma factor (TIGR02999 family)